MSLLDDCITPQRGGLEAGTWARRNAGKRRGRRGGRARATKQGDGKRQRGEAFGTPPAITARSGGRPPCDAPARPARELARWSTARQGRHETSPPTPRCPDQISGGENNKSSRAERAAGQASNLPALSKARSREIATAIAIAGVVGRGRDPKGAVFTARGRAALPRAPRPGRPRAGTGAATQWKNFGQRGRNCWRGCLFVFRFYTPAGPRRARDDAAGCMQPARAPHTASGAATCCAHDVASRQTTPRPRPGPPRVQYITVPAPRASLFRSAPLPPRPTTTVPRSPAL